MNDAMKLLDAVAGKIGWEQIAFFHDQTVQYRDLHDPEGRFIGGFATKVPDDMHSYVSFQVSQVSVYLHFGPNGQGIYSASYISYDREREDEVRIDIYDAPDGDRDLLRTIDAAADGIVSYAFRDKAEFTDWFRGKRGTE